MSTRKFGVLVLLIISSFLSQAASANPALPGQPPTPDSIIQFVYISDVHFGITRHQFDGDSNVDSRLVNIKLAAKINTLPTLTLPDDQGVQAGQPIKAVDYFIETGDIANRQENDIQGAASSWSQFQQIYLNGLTLHNQHGQPATVLLTPGNHDISDAIGFYRKMQPAKDPTSVVGIYNLMLHPAMPLTNSSFRYPDDKINYSRNIGGCHFLFINIWPDSANRVWMEKDLSQVDPRTPVIIFAHDPPDGDAGHFTNPNGAHDINPRDRFENLLEEVSKDQQPPAPPSAANNPADAKPQNDRIEQLGFVSFLKAHPNIKVYFHGHNNWTEFYTYTGPDQDIALPAFRVDSPMKGKYSSKDETRLSFLLISLDTRTRKITVRECLWNSDPTHPDLPIRWGDSKTLGL
jgi:hypothetical protein